MKKLALLLAWCVLAVGVAEPVRAALLLKMQCQETTGSVVADASGNGNDGTWNTGTCATYTTVVTGIPLPRLFTPSPGAYITLDTPIDLTGPFTIEAWLRRDSLGEFNLAIGQDVNDAVIGRNEVAGLALRIGGGARNFADVGEGSGLVFVSVTRDASNLIRLRADAGSENSPLSGGAFAGTFTLTRVFGFVDGSWGGPIGGIYVYDELRTQPQIQADMEEGGGDPGPPADTGAGFLLFFGRNAYPWRPVDIDPHRSPFDAFFGAIAP